MQWEYPGCGIPVMLPGPRCAIVCRMTRLPDHSPPVVLSVRDLREEVRAGLGRAALSVRTLDGVSLTVHSGELIVLRGGVASGAASLLNALAGVSRHQSGVRLPASGLRVRRACISARAFAAIDAAWREVLPAPVLAAEPHPSAPLVYVFRVRSPRAAQETRGRDGLADPAAWRAWAHALRAGGGSVVAHVTNHFTVTPHPPARYESDGVRSTAVHEPFSGTRALRIERTGGVRTITLAAGRIVSADPAIRPWSSP